MANTTDYRMDMVKQAEEEAYFEEMARQAKERGVQRAHKAAHPPSLMGALGSGLDILGTMGRNMQENERRMAEENKKKGMNNPFSLW